MRYFRNIYKCLISGEKVSKYKYQDKFEVTDSRIPRDGSYYPKDIKNIFPKSIRKKIEDVHQDGIIKRLSLDNQQKAKFYFN